MKVFPSPRDPGSFNGVKPPSLKTGRYIWPDYLFPSNMTLTLTANRLYTARIFVDETTTYAGAWCANSGTGDNGVVLRMAVGNDDTFALEKDFGVITLTGVAQARTAAAPVTLFPGWHRICMVSSGTPAMNVMDFAALITAVGYRPAPSLASKFGTFSPQVNSAISNNIPIGEYGSFTYGALSDPLPSMTATLHGNPNSTSAGELPLMGLYK